MPSNVRQWCVLLKKQSQETGDLAKLEIDATARDCRSLGIHGCHEHVCKAHLANARFCFAVNFNYFPKAADFGGKWRQLA